MLPVMRRDYIGVNLLFLLAAGTVDLFALTGCGYLLLRDANASRHITMRRPDNGCGEPATPNHTSSGLWFSGSSFLLSCALLLSTRKKKTQIVTFRSARLRNLQFHQRGQQKSKYRLALAAAESQSDCLPLPGQWCYDGKQRSKNFMWNFFTVVIFLKTFLCTNIRK